MFVVIACMINTKAQNENIYIQVHFRYLVECNPLVVKVSIDLIVTFFSVRDLLKIKVYLDEKKYLCNCSRVKGFEYILIELQTFELSVLVSRELSLYCINIPSYILNKMKHRLLSKSLQRILMNGFFTVLNGKTCVQTTQMFRF